VCPSTHLCSPSFSSNLLEWCYTAEYCNEGSIMLQVFKSEPFRYISRFWEYLTQLIKSTVIWEVTPRSVIEVYQSSEKMYCLHLQGQK
jgi:hypothetical protein